MRKIMITAAALALAVPVLAGEPGTFGLGFTTSDAPIGGAYVINDQVCVTAGLGLHDYDSGASSFAVEVGLPVALHEGDRSMFGVRPGVLFESFSPADDTSSKLADTALADGSITTFQAWLFFAWKATDNLSLNLSHGLNVRNTSPEEGDSFTDIFSVGNNATSLGFYYWFN